MHYANGREARVGDHVVGRCYNTEKLVAGVLMSVTPGADACSALVGYLDVFPAEAQPGGLYTALCEVHGDQQHGAAGEKKVTRFRTDYTHCANLMHVDDVVMIGDNDQVAALPSSPPND